MKNGTTILKLSLHHLVLSASLITALTACTKQRPADINDDETKSQVFAISELQGQQYNIQTGVALQSMTDLQNEPHALAEKPQVEIKSSNAPSRLQGIFSSLPVAAQSGQTYPVRLSVDAKAVTLFRIVSDVKDLSDIEQGSMIQQTVTDNKAKKQINLVPMAQIVVKDYGTLCRKKNDYGENTSNLIICHTDFKSATHVQISIKGDDLTAALGQHEMDQVFLKDRLNAKITTVSKLQEQMKFSLYPTSDDKVITYVSTDAGSQVNLLVYKIAKRSQITDDKIKQQAKSSLGLGQILQCPKEVLATLSAADQSDCVLMLAYTLKGDAVRAETQTTDDMGRAGIKVELKKTSATSSNLLKFDEATPAVVVNPSDLTQLNPYNTIRLSDIVNKEFMMRRTFEDAASTITGFGPGASGYMDMVRFELQDKALVVRRMTMVNGMINATNLDHEEVMSIPVTYKKIDSATSSSVAPRLIDATKTDAQYAFLDWTSNTINSTNSPLSYAGEGADHCFQSTSRQDITGLDNRIQDGVLSFSISGSYSFKPRCSTFTNLSDYWYGGGMQSNFNIKERVSFMLNKGTNDNNPGPSIAFNAQNTMGYGVFTMDKVTPDKFGNAAGLMAGEKPLPVIHDFSSGKQLIYNLGGLPEDKSSWQYKALLDGTKEVVADWNKALHRAFTGTKLDRSGDFILLKVDGIDDTVGHLGDLDRNYIWNFDKNMDSGLLGLSQAAPNPRSGRIEQNNVLMYGGNLLDNIGYVRNSLRKRVAYRQWKAQVFDGLVKQAATDNAANSDVNTTTTEAAPNAQKKSITDAIRQMSKKTTYQAQTKNLTARLRSQLPSLDRAMALDKSVQDKQKKFFDSISYGSIDRLVQQAVENKATDDGSAMTALADIEMLKSKNISVEQRQLLQDEARRLSLSSNFSKNFNKGPNCILSAEELDSTLESDQELLDDSKTPAVYKRWYKATLAHEMGHSLGLTHNFEGSFDKANFLFADEKESPTSRNYSSIMDYTPDEYVHYAGPGPYDVRALRVAYTGLIEISPALGKDLKDDGKGGKFLGSVTDNSNISVTKTSTDFYYEISVEAYRTAVLGTDWFRLSAANLKQLPLKSYKYCTDKDIGTDPVCQRWDMGTTPSEIVKHFAAQYEDEYALFNTRGDDRIRTTSKGKYIGFHLLRNFFQMRPFLEEAFYRQSHGKDYYTDEEKTQALDAAAQSFRFFLKVASAPTEDDLGFNDPKRIHLFQHDTGDKGIENLMVETKPMEDIRVPGSDFSYDLRGIETDRQFALLFLTTQGLGGERYDEYEMGVTYFVLEKAAYNLDRQHSLLANLFKGLLLEAPPSYIPVGDSGIAPLPEDQFHSDVTLNLRMSAQIDTVHLENSASTDESNYASLFRVASSQNAVPQDRAWITKAGQVAGSNGSMKFWAMDNATVINDVVIAAKQYRGYLDNTDKLSDELIRLFHAAKNKDQAAATAATFKKAAFTGDPVVDLKNANEANTVHLNESGTSDKFAAQRDLVINDLIALNKDGSLLPDQYVKNIIANYKNDDGSAKTPEDATKFYFNNLLIETLNYMYRLGGMAQQNEKMTDEDAATPENQKALTIIREAHMREVQRNPIFGVADHAMVNDKTQTLDGNFNLVDNSWTVHLIGMLVYSDSLKASSENVSRNLETLNQILFAFHPEMNRY